MTRLLAHRGPDGEGLACPPEASLGHRRLAVIDLATGMQPMSTPDGRYTIVFNGEIYNFREVRRTLEQHGSTFVTQSDTEVLLASFARWGVESLARVRGMFAFAVWDAWEKSLWLVRDRLGVKPLYYTQAGGHLLFASEMKALLAHPSVPRRMNPQAVDDFLAYLYIPAPQTIFEGIKELPPAHWLRWHAGTLHLQRYWDALPQPEHYKEAAAQEEVAARLHDAVAIRRVSDVPLGAFLSGGLDSSSIVAWLARASTDPVRTFSLGFGAGEERYTELEFARIAARHFGTEHRELEIRPRSVALLPALVDHFDEPFGNPTALLMYELSKLTRQHVTVALAGDAGDEVFLGYPRYRGVVLHQRAACLPHWMRRGMAGLSGWLSEDSSGAHQMRRRREFLETAGTTWEAAYIRWVTYFHPEERRALYTPEFHAAVGSYRAEQFIESWFARVAHCAPLDQASYVDLHTFLPHNLLAYGDRMSMAHGLEVRLPFTDHRLIELALRLPSGLKLRGRKSKHVLREAMRAMLPEQILNRSKLGLNPPLGIWLRGELAGLVDQRLSPDAVRRAGWFRPQAVSRLIQDFRTGRRDYSLHIWALLVLDQWRRQILEQSEGEGGVTELLRATA
jgi:asparagine synthase (glutamine-hydrolysing)